MPQDENNPTPSAAALRNGFILKNSIYVESLQCFVYEFIHKRIGSKMVHVSNQDTNNCFACAFLTIPQDSTGVAHILEHIVLCGSQKFSVRDPFFSMIKRSLKTFMNALTACDWTMYPYATQNKKDFYNLMDVYLDAVFFPKLDRLSFLQEGHRLEYEALENGGEKLNIKGIVYNEMKGVMSTQSAVMMQSMREALFPNITYGHNSGGEPTNIMHLTYEELKNFHAKHYHPSNACFFSYGNFPFESHLQKINQQVMPYFEFQEQAIPVPDEKRFVEPKEFSFPYPAEKEDGSYQFAVGWLTCKINDPVTVLSLSLLEQVLLGSSGSPLRKVLIESNLGKNLSDVAGLEEDIRELTFGIGLKGMQFDDIPKLKTLIFDALKGITKEGLNQDLVQSELHQMELRMRAISGSSYPYGLNILFRFFGHWIHGGNPFENIDFDLQISKLKEKLEEPLYLERLIVKYLLENPHQVQVTLYPDLQYHEKQEQKIRLHLDELEKNIGIREKRNIRRQAEELKIFQDQEEDLSVLPGISISDVLAVEGPEPVCHKTNIGGVNAYSYALSTNGLFSAHLYFELAELSDEDKKRLPIMGSLLTSVGCEGMTYDQLSLQVNRYTGGISVAPHTRTDFKNTGRIDNLLCLSGSSLASNIGNLFSLFDTIISKRSFWDFKRIKNVIEQRYDQISSSFLQSAHSYALRAANRFLHPSANTDEIYSGITQLQFLRSLNQMSDDELRVEIGLLEEISWRVFNRATFSCVLTGETTFLPQAEEYLRQFIINFSKGEEYVQSSKTSFQPQYLKELWQTNTPVSYVVQSFKAPRFGEDQAPEIQVMSFLLQGNFLHREIREQGGAYGAMSSYDSEEGIISFLSYRDPLLSKTVNSFEQGAEWVMRGDFTDAQVEEAILQTFSRLDTPLSPTGRTLRDYHNQVKGKNKVMRENYREQLLKTNRQGIINAAQNFLNNDKCIVAVTSEAIIDNDPEIMQKHPFKCRKV